MWGFRNWLVGMTSTIASIGISLSDIEATLRILGLIGGLIITVITIIKAVRNWKSA